MDLEALLEEFNKRLDDLKNDARPEAVRAALEALRPLVNQLVETEVRDGRR